jgi:hypothetical protein
VRLARVLIALAPVGLNPKFTTARCPCCSPADRARAFSLLPAASVNVDVGAKVVLMVAILEYIFIGVKSYLASWR